MDIRQDPNSIPHYSASGRLGELQPNQPEQAQSSVQLDPTADGDAAASGDTPVGSGRDSPLADVAPACDSSWPARDASSTLDAWAPRPARDRDVEPGSRP